MHQLGVNVNEVCVPHLDVAWKRRWSQLALVTSFLESPILDSVGTPMTELPESVESRVRRPVVRYGFEEAVPLI